jgi:iron complex outermembrane receptor protein
MRTNLSPSRHLLLIVLLAASAPPAIAQTSTPPPAVNETVVVTATASPVSAEDVARSVIVLTHDEIARLPAQSIDDVLRYASSVDVQARGPMGVQNDFALRGAAFGQVLVMVDGVRINDAQSGHHNGDIPVPLDDVDRVEVLFGPGSSVHGADAFGGTINVITRHHAREQSVHVEGGQFGLASGGGTATVGSASVRETVSGNITRSSGFEPDRDFQTIDLSSGTALGPRTYLFTSYLRKQFGAYGFYGPAPSREWTNQTLVALDRQLTTGGAWRSDLRLSYRTHGDRFLYDQTVPDFPVNQHRTHEVQAALKASREVSRRTRLTVGAEAGGDWIRSNALGDHDYSRVSGYAEVQQTLGRRTIVYPGVRVDRYSNFGTAWSPSLAVSTWLNGAVKLHASVGHAFRIPTFTDLYYSDPSNQGNPLLTPERAWSTEAGMQWTPAASWLTSATFFDRREQNVIDYIRQTPAEKWQAENLRAVSMDGVELALRRALPADSFVQLQYTYLTADAGTADFLSKYVLDYARHSLGATASTALPGGFGLGQRIDYKRRADGRRYWVVDTRLSKQVGAAQFYVDGTNLLNTSYQEILGVDMPGRWVMAGVRLSR